MIIIPKLNNINFIIWLPQCIHSQFDFSIQIMLETMTNTFWFLKIFWLEIIHEVLMQPFRKTDISYPLIRTHTFFLCDYY